jgi:phenylpropionate dioxygenase-like ring-hydroxylating dioxygenase large terminal subunit
MVSLGMGKLVNGAIQCGYHGLSFDENGVCVHNPQGAPPKTMRVRPYPVIERHSMIWIWMGEASRADPSLIPDLSFQDPETAYVGKGYLHVRASYILEIENILDLSHIEFLHATTLGSSEVSQGDYSWHQEGETIWSQRDIIGEVMTDDLATSMGRAIGEKVDRWLHVRWNAPANLVLFTGVVTHGQPKEEGVENPTAHLFTPETKNSTH